MSDDVRPLLPEAYRAAYDHLLLLPASPTRAVLIEALRAHADPAWAALPADYRVEYDRALAQPPSPVRDGLLVAIQRMAAGDHDYFAWDEVPVRVACAGGACQTFRDGAWQAGGPSYAVRQEECEPLDAATFAARFPHAAHR